MKAAILYYDGFCEFEVALTALQLQDHLITIAPEDRVYMSQSNQQLIPDQTIAQVDVNTIDLLIIPGGDPEYLYDNHDLKKMMTNLNNQKKYIAGICGGTFLMANFGLLKGKQCTGDAEGLKDDKAYAIDFKDSIKVDQDYVQDANMITATGQAFVKFSIKIAQLMDCISDDTEAKATYEWFKYRGEQLD